MAELCWNCGRDMIATDEGDKIVLTCANRCYRIERPKPKPRA